MRDPNRIPKVLGVLRRIWEKNPDLRLMQLLHNANFEDLEVCGDYYHLEDDKLLNNLKKYEEKTNE